MTASALVAEERAVLLSLARAAIDDALNGGSALAAAVARSRITDALREPRGAFVTLKALDASMAKPRLRGCIGTVAARGPLYRTVVETAPKAALEDPRFPPLTAEELASVWIEISALTPLTELAAPSLPVSGRDGVQLSCRGKQAVFLPQVAAEQGWQPEQFLQHLASKAGLPRDGWRDAELRVFQAEVFGEASDAGRHP